MEPVISKTYLDSFLPNSCTDNRHTAKTLSRYTRARPPFLSYVTWPPGTPRQHPYYCTPDSNTFAEVR